MPTVRRSRSDLDLDRVDWKRVAETSDAEIERQIAADPDTAPIFTDDELAAAKRVEPDLTAGGVRAVRERLGLSQEEFAARFGFSVKTLRNYEEGRRAPRGPVQVLLRVIASEPDAVIRALRRRRDRRPSN